MRQTTTHSAPKSVEVTAFDSHATEIYQKRAKALASSYSVGLEAGGLPSRLQSAMLYGATHSSLIKYDVARALSKHDFSYSQRIKTGQTHS